LKRLVSAVLVLLALGAAAFFFIKLRPFLPERSRAAELAPAETIVFVQLPNARQAALHFLQTDLYQIWREPDVQAFLTKPRLKAPWMREWEQRLDAAVLAAPGEAFVAVTSLDGPKFVAGFAFAGSRRSAETLAEDLRTKFAPKAVLALRSNWVLMASDRALLESLVARFEAKGGPTLATEPRFLKATAGLGVERDLVVFGRPDALEQFLPAGRAPVAAAENDAIAMATRIVGDRLHDTISLPAAAGEQAVLSGRMLALAPSQPLLYYVGEIGFLPPGMEGLRGVLPGLAALEKSLAGRGLTWRDLAHAVGPEWATIVQWPEDTALPTLVIGAEIADTEKARAFREALTDPATFGAPWAAEVHDGVTVSTAPAQAFSFVQPSLALTDHFALMGTNSQAVLAAFSSKNAPPAAPTPFQTAAQAMPPQASTFAYLDFPRLFERAYRLARPVITLSLAFSPEIGAQFDAGKLPPVEGIARHLKPIVLSATRADDRTVIESEGSVTMPELLLVIGGASAASRFPQLSGILPGSPKVPLSPAPQRAAATPLRRR
jgi:hypothetical protein